MRFGFVTNYSPERIEMAARAGYDGVEISFKQVPTKSDLAQIKDKLQEQGVRCLTVFQGQRYADPDPAAARAARNNFAKFCDVGKALGTKLITCLAWVPREVSLDEKLDFYVKTFSRFAEVAEDKGCRIAIENYPAQLGNLAWSPATWERMFNALPTKTIGLEYDPSHLAWQGIDYVAALKKFASRVYAFHAKDTQIDHARLKYVGINGDGWWRFRVPGQGDINFAPLFAILNEVEYKGDIIVEHEDNVFRTSEKRFEEGLRHASRYLQQFVV